MKDSILKKEDKNDIAFFSPFDIKFSLSTLIEEYKSSLKSELSTMEKAMFEEKILLAEENPELLDGITDISRVKEYSQVIQEITSPLFQKALTHNEIKAIVIPFHQFMMNPTKRLRNILKTEEDFVLPKMRNFSDDEIYISACSMILNSHYGYKLDFRQPYYFDIRDKQGVMKHYRIMYNADFIKVSPTEQVIEINKEIYDELISDFGNIELWKKYFKPNSWRFQGFGIAQLFDVTKDVAISDLKSKLLEMSNNDPSYIEEIREIYRSILGLPNLNVGFTAFDSDFNLLEHIPKGSVKSLLLDGDEKAIHHEFFCKGSFHTIFEDRLPFIISNTEKYINSPAIDKPLAKSLIKNGYKSMIIYPVVSSTNEILGIMEIASKNIGELNGVNTKILDAIVPFINSAVENEKMVFESNIEAIIQQEFSPLHPSVYWRFYEEAFELLKAKLSNQDYIIKEIIFEKVYPLYGQIDITGSSDARNKSTISDIKLQLDLLNEIFNLVFEKESLPIYEETIHRLKGYRKQLTDKLSADEEILFIEFLEKEIHPVLQHLDKKDALLDIKIESYFNNLEKDTHVVYHHRKKYDDTVNMLNIKLANYLDLQQNEAQKIFPHHFQRYKTDGIDHNIYIGQSITKLKKYSDIYLKNIRLWQLQTMCEMERMFYDLQENEISLSCASMVFVYNHTLDIQFRMDEKQFDVDGSYNARYEVLKKRLDKSKVKGSNQRLTLPKKLTIVYSSDQDEEEYMKYISFLETKNYLKKNSLEKLEIEDLQGVIGLRALRVDINYKQ